MATCRALSVSKTFWVFSGLGWPLRMRRRAPILDSRRGKRGLPPWSAARPPISYSYLDSTALDGTMANKSFAFVSLGCPKNTVDSERMLGKLVQDGYALTPDASGADVVVVNTCGFIEPARQESLSVIREMLELKKAGKVGAVVVAGCMAERQREVLLAQVPEVDQIVGVFGREEIAAVVDRAVSGRDREGSEIEQRSLFRPAPVRALED